jgi:hypothetical protein
MNATVHTNELGVVANGGLSRKGRRYVGYRANANQGHWVLGLHNGVANRANAILNDQARVLAEIKVAEPGVMGMRVIV